MSSNYSLIYKHNVTTYLSAKMFRHCEARSAAAIQENLYGLLRHYVPRNDGAQRASDYYA